MAWHIRREQAALIHCTGSADGLRVYAADPSPRMQCLQDKPPWQALRLQVEEMIKATLAAAAPFSPPSCWLT